ncbi:LOW QUALITY PROTEIN: hypothetical protein V1478_004132 [Vespula squamosa]|uniref:Uncharacterized protein n=1 Tax=Vespula squamosa TaxID=30214 RepID=A0ABD2BNU7_VESSQ
MFANFISYLITYSKQEIFNANNIEIFFDSIKFIAQIKFILIDRICISSQTNHTLLYYRLMLSSIASLNR